MKILFVYPNAEGYRRIPIGISVLSSVLKSAGHKIKLFDATFYSEDIDNICREKCGIVKSVDNDNKRKDWDRIFESSIEDDLIDTLNKFRPDLICFSIVENNWALATKLIRVCKSKTKTPIVVGGVFPTLAPEILLANNDIDILCFGEGEDSILELVTNLERGRSITSLSNLLLKHNANLYRNRQRKLKNMDELPFQDWDVFDERCLYKPFMGKMWKVGFVEMSRGCPYDCTYCCEAGLRNLFYENSERSRWVREKSVERGIEEIEYLKNRHHLEIIFFVDETFLFLNLERLKRFGTLWKKRIALPYVIQTRPESITEEKLAILKDSNCISISMGIEAGDEKFRRKILFRRMSNEKIITAFKLVKKSGIRNTSNIMIGFPYETEYHIQKSIDLCRLAEVDSVAVNIFAPYHGTLLHWICEKAGFIEQGYQITQPLFYGSILKMPQLSRETIYHYFINFKKYLEGQLPLNVLSNSNIQHTSDFSEFDRHLSEFRQKKVLRW